jgi:lauroyl/myristoyl acyltransferase
MTPTEAGRVFRGCLASEAREEADSAFLIRHPEALDGFFPPAVDLPAEAGPVIYATLHLGTPVLGYLCLASRVAPDLALVARGLDPANPLPATKRRFAVRKVAWVEATAGRPFFATDAAAMLRVRAHLRDGKSIYLLADVPGDAVSRSASCTLFGERVQLASGIATLARIAASPVQTFAITREAEGIAVRPGPRLEPASGARGDGVLADVLVALAPFIRAHADQWWMWPYLPAAFDSPPR